MKIGVYGSENGFDESAVPKARAIGMRLAEREHTVVTGGCRGLPYYAVLGAKERGGICIAYSPARNIDHHCKLGYPTDGFDEFVFVPEVIPDDYIRKECIAACAKVRNVASVANIDAGVIIGGRIGTAHEFMTLYDLEKDIGILRGSGGITTDAIDMVLRAAAKESRSKIIWERDPGVLVDRLVEQLISEV